MKETLKFYLDIVQKMSIVTALILGGYEFFAAPVESAYYRTKENEIGWVYHGRSTDTENLNFEIAIEQLTKIGPGTPIKIRSDRGVNLRAEPRTQFMETAGTHAQYLGTFTASEGRVFCVLDSVKSGFRSIWLYVRVLGDGINDSKIHNDLCKED